jgi:mannose-6-phosphate isomerase-like protein (cupin superfamily)
MPEPPRRDLASGLALLAGGMALGVPGAAAQTAAKEGRSMTASTARFDITAIAKSFPETADTLLLDQYLTNSPQASARVFRVYRPTPPHYHATCDEYLYVLSGRGTFWMTDASTEAEFGPGQLLYFTKGTVHALPKMLDEPVVFLSVDTPRRDPKDVIFVNPADGTPDSFVKPKDY